MREQAAAAAFFGRIRVHASSLVPRTARLLTRGADDPALAYLLFVVRHHRHGLRTRVILLGCAVAVIAAVCLPMRVFSFAAWVLFAQLSHLFPLLTFAQEVAARNRGADLLAAPISGRDHVRGFTRFFVLSAVFAAAVHAVFWASVLLLRLTGRGEFAMDADAGAQVAYALLLFVLATAVSWSVVWSALWSPVLAVGVLVAASAALGHLHGWERLLFLSSLPVDAVAPLCLLAAGLVVFGWAMRHVVARTLTRRLARRLFG